MSVQTVTGTLGAMLSGDIQSPVFEYGPDLPTYVLCEDPPPANTVFDLFDASPSGTIITQINMGGGFSPAGLPVSQNFPVGLTIVTYIIQNQTTMCVDTAQIGILIGSPSYQVTMSVAASQTPVNACVPDSVEFLINTTQGFELGMGYQIMYNYEGYAVSEVMFPATGTFSFWHTFPTSSCGFSIGAALNTYDMQVITMYGCQTLGNASGNASGIYFSEPPVASAIPSSTTACAGGPAITIDNQSTGEWIQGQTCHSSPNFFWTILTGSAGVDWNVGNQLGSANNAPNTPSQWTSGSDPLSISFLIPGTYTIQLDAGGSGACALATDEVTICVQEAIDPGFTSAVNATCIPATVNTTDITDYTGLCNPATYEWTAQALTLFCGGTVSLPDQITQNAQFTITDPGIYLITQHVTTPCGEETSIDTVTIYGPPVGTLNPLSASPCVGDVLTLDSQVQGCGQTGAVPVFVVVSGPATITPPDQLDITGPGQIIVALQINNACSGGALVVLDQDTINAQAPPSTPVVTIDPAPVCVGDSVTISIIEQANVSVYSITIGGVTYPESSITVEATVAMNGVVVATAGAPGCDQDTTLNLVVVPVAASTINGAGTPLCLGDSVQLSVTGAGTSYTWQEVPGAVVGNGPSIWYTPAATITIAVSDTVGGCVSYDEELITVNPLPVVSAPGDVTLCADGTPYTLDPSNNGGTFASTSTYFSLPGLITPVSGQAANFDVIYSESDANGCAGLDTLHVTIDTSISVPNAGPDTTLCMNAVPYVPIAGAWQDELPYFVGGVFDPMLVPGAGNYTITLCATQCVNICDGAIISVVDTPTVVFDTLPSFCIGDAGAQLSAGPLPGTWSGSPYVSTTGFWDNPSATAGAHIVCYTMADPVTECSSTACDTVHVTDPPLASFAPFTACAGQAVVPDNLSTGTSWEWSIDGGIPIPGFEPSLNFPLAGDVDVTLVAMGSSSCSHDTTISIPVDTVPVVDVLWTVLDSCGDGSVQATNNAIFPTATHAWYQNGVVIDTSAEPPVFFLPGSVMNDTTYYLVYVQTNDCGSDSSFVYITIRPAPVADFVIAVPAICLSDSLLLSDISYGGIDSTVIDWGDNVLITSNDSVMQHLYTTTGTFDISLYAYGPCNAIDTMLQQVTVLPNQVDAVIGVSAYTLCAGELLFVENGSQGDTAIIIHFNDPAGTTSISDNTSFLYTEPGVYPLTLVAYGCGLDTAVVMITVEPQPALALPPDTTVCAGESIPFQVNGVGLVGIMWDFGDATIDSIPNPVHTYNAVGDHTVVVTVLNDTTLCASADSMVVHVAPSPLSNFAISDSVFCVPLSADLFNSSTIGLSYAWYVDSAIHSYQYTPQPFVFQTAGPHVVSLTVTDQFTQCSDSTTITVVANAAPNSNFALAPIDSCMNQVGVTTTNSSDAGSSALWYIDGVFQGAQWNLDTTFTGLPGVHAVMLVSGGFGDCTDTSVVPFYLAQRPVAAFDLTGPNCEEAALSLENNSEFAQYFEWRWPVPVDSTAVSDLFEPDHVIFEDPDTYSVQLIVTALNGCVDSIVQYVTVHPVAHVLEPTYAIPAANQCGVISLNVVTDQPAVLEWFYNGTEHISYAAQLAWELGDRARCGPVPITLRTTLGTCIVDRNFRPEFTQEHVCMFVPNAFTPDGDGINELFKAVGPSAQAMKLSVFNRWGEQLFHTENINIGWDGLYGGALQKQDVYIYKLKYCDEDRVGHVTLLVGDPDR